MSINDCVNMIKMSNGNKTVYISMANSYFDNVYKKQNTDKDSVNLSQYMKDNLNEFKKMNFYMTYGLLKDKDMSHDNVVGLLTKMKDNVYINSYDLSKLMDGITPSITVILKVINSTDRNKYSDDNVTSLKNALNQLTKDIDYLFSNKNKFKEWFKSDYLMHFQIIISETKDTKLIDYYKKQMEYVIKILEYVVDMIEDHNKMTKNDEVNIIYREDTMIYSFMHTKMSMYIDELFKFCDTILTNAMINILGTIIFNHFIGKINNKPINKSFMHVHDSSAPMLVYLLLKNGYKITNISNGNKNISVKESGKFNMETLDRQYKPVFYMDNYMLVIDKGMEKLKKILKYLFENMALNPSSIDDIGKKIRPMELTGMCEIGNMF